MICFMLFIISVSIICWFEFSRHILRSKLQDLKKNIKEKEKRQGWRKTVEWWTIPLTILKYDIRINILDSNVDCVTQ